MDTIIKIGKESMLSDEHLVKTDKGWIKAKELKVGDNIFNFEGNITKIERIVECGKRPDAPIVGEFNKS